MNASDAAHIALNLFQKMPESIRKYLVMKKNRHIIAVFFCGFRNLICWNACRIVILYDDKTVWSFNLYQVCLFLFSPLWELELDSLLIHRYNSNPMDIISKFIVYWSTVLLGVVYIFITVPTSNFPTEPSIFDVIIKNSNAKSNPEIKIWLIFHDFITKYTIF